MMLTCYTMNEFQSVLDVVVVAAVAFVVDAAVVHFWQLQQQPLL